MTKYTLSLPPTLGIKNAEEIVQHLHPLFEACAAGDRIDLALDMSGVYRMYPTAMAALCAAIKYLERAGCLQLIEFTPPSNQDAHNYITRMEFYRHLGLAVSYPYNVRASTGRLFEVTEVVAERDVSETSRRLGEIIQANFGGLGHTGAQALKIAISEVLDNVFHHANSPVNAIVCAQTYLLNREVEIAIVDCGCGYHSSLVSSPVHRHCRDANHAIRMATQFMVTSTGDEMRGMGLFIATELTRRNKGKMFISSDDGVYRLLNGYELPEHMCYNGDARWPGAIVSFLFDLNGPLSTKEIYDDIRPYEEDYEEEDDLIDDSDDLILPF